MAATWTMFVFRIVADVAAELVTAVRVALADCYSVFLDSTALLMAQVTILQIIRVAIVFDCGVPAAGAMCVACFDLSDMTTSFLKIVNAAYTGDYTLDPLLRNHGRVLSADSANGTPNGPVSANWPLACTFVGDYLRTVYVNGLMRSSTRCLKCRNDLWGRHRLCRADRIYFGFEAL